MDKVKKILLVIAFLILSVTPCFATDYYIDSNAAGGGDGTVGTPWNSMDDFTPTRGNAYYFKGGSSFTLDNYTINTADSGTDTIYFGAYLGAGVHEEDTGENFGEYCSDTITKKPIFKDADTSGTPFSANANYLTFNSVSFQDGGVNCYFKGSSQRYEYCYFKNGDYGLRNLSNPAWTNNYIGYCYFVTNRGNGPLGEGIQFTYVSDSIIEYCVLDGYDHSTIMLYFSNACDDNIIRYNKFLSWDQTSSEGITINGEGNQVHHNFFYKTGTIHFTQGSGNEFYGNVLVGLAPHWAPDKVLNFQALTATAVNGNIAFNNTLYLLGTETYETVGVQYYVTGADKGANYNNTVANNIFLHWLGTNRPIFAGDPYGTINSSASDADGNKLFNNDIYGQAGNYAAMESNYYASATTLNAAGANYSGNISSDPQLSDPANNEFWPTSDDSPVVGAGYAVSSTADQHDKLFGYGTVLNTDPEPITVVLVDQTSPATIGAFRAFGVGAGGTITTQTEGDPIESTVAAGGLTVTLNLSGDTFVPTACQDNAITDALIAGLTAAGSQTHGLLNEITPIMAFGQFSRDSNTQITWTVPASNYALLNGNEDWTWTIPASATTGSSEIVATPSITIQNESDAPAAPGNGAIGVYNANGAIGQYNANGSVGIGQ